MEIIIKAPELTNALAALAAALQAKNGGMPYPTPNAAAPVAPQPTVAVPVQPVAMPQQPQVQQPTLQSPPTAVPTSVPAYTLEQLAVAATPLMDAGKGEDLRTLLRMFGVEALTQLPKELYGDFATALRGMGAKI